MRVRAVQRATIVFLDGIGGDLWPYLTGTRHPAPTATRTRAVTLPLAEPAEDIGDQSDDDHEGPLDADEEDAARPSITDADADRLTTALIHMDRDTFFMDGPLDDANEQDGGEAYGGYDDGEETAEPDDDDDGELLQFSPMAEDIGDEE